MKQYMRQRQSITIPFVIMKSSKERLGLKLKEVSIRFPIPSFSQSPSFHVLLLLSLYFNGAKLPFSVCLPVSCVVVCFSDSHELPFSCPIKVDTLIMTSTSTSTATVVHAHHFHPSRLLFFNHLFTPET